MEPITDYQKRMIRALILTPILTIAIAVYVSITRDVSWISLVVVNSIVVVIIIFGTRRVYNMYLKDHGGFPSYRQVKAAFRFSKPQLFRKFNQSNGQTIVYPDQRNQRLRLLIELFLAVAFLVAFLAIIEFRITTNWLTSAIAGCIIGIVLGRLWVSGSLIRMFGYDVIPSPTWVTWLATTGFANNDPRIQQMATNIPYRFSAILLLFGIPFLNWHNSLT